MNSYLATARILRTRPLHCSHEDFLERGNVRSERAQRQPSLDHLLQDRVRGHARPEEEADRRLSVPSSCRSPALHSGQGAEIAGSAHDDASVRVASSNRIHLSFKQDAAAIEKEQAMTKLLDVLQLVRGDEDRLACRHAFLEQLDGEASIHGIEPVEGFVDEKDLRIAHQRRGELNFLLVSLGQLSDSRALADIQLHPPQQSARLLARLLPRHSLELAQIGEQVQYPRSRRQAALLGKVADSLQRLPAWGSSQQQDFPRVRSKQVHAHSKQGRLPSPIGPEQTEDLAWLKR